VGQRVHQRGEIDIEVQKVDYRGLRREIGGGWSKWR